jgi:hypothetical protein
MIYHRRQEEFYRERIQWTNQQYKRQEIDNLYDELFDMYGEPDESTGWN